MRPSVRSDEASKRARNADKRGKSESIPASTFVPLREDLLGGNVLGKEGEEKDDDKESDDVQNELLRG